MFKTTVCVPYVMDQEQWEWKWMEKLQQQEQHPSFLFQGVGSAQLD